MSDQTLLSLIARLERWENLNEIDKAFILNLPQITRDFRANAFIVREGDRTQHAMLLVSGFAFSSLIAGDGSRQIFEIYCKDDLFCLDAAVLGVSDHNVQALSDVTVVCFDMKALTDQYHIHGRIITAIIKESLSYSSIYRKWMLNIGRREARSRIAHLLCEMFIRLQHAGLTHGNEFELPMTQEVIADTLAITNVHVSRILKSLAEDGLISRSNRYICIENFTNLARVGDFDRRYLNLERRKPPLLD